MTALGYLTRTAFYPKLGLWRDQWIYHPNPLLNLWGVWDSGWYLDIAQNGYSSILQSDLPKRVCCGQSNFGFFPLYPSLIKLTNFAVGNYFIAGLIISNLALILSGVFLYRLARLNNSKKTSLRSVKYMFFFPSAFILSGVFSESLFLLLLIAAFYFAKKKKWFLAGVAGFFLSLTKQTGLLMIIPLLYVYLKQNEFKIKKIKPDILYLSFLPLGLLFLTFYSYFLEGDPLLFFSVKATAWDVYLANPAGVFISFMLSGKLVFKIIALYAFFLTILLVVFRKKIKTSFFLLSLIVLAVPMTTGAETFIGIIRYSSVVFPFFILFASLTRDKNWGKFISSVLISSQIIFMVFWSNALLVI